jgi:hypothetical protein
MKLLGLCCALVLGINSIHIREENHLDDFSIVPGDWKAACFRHGGTNICGLNNSNKYCCKGTCTKMGQLYENCSGEKILASSVYDF